MGSTLTSVLVKLLINNILQSIRVDTLYALLTLRTGFSAMRTLSCKIRDLDGCHYSNRAKNMSRFLPGIGLIIMFLKSVSSVSDAASKSSSLNQRNVREKQE